MIYLSAAIPRHPAPAFFLALVLWFGLCLTSSSARADYLVASGDVLDVTVFRVPDLSHEVRVDVDGRIAFPPLGRIDVAGRTIDEVASLLRDALSSGQVLTEPRVTVAIAETRPVFIGGDVATPGAYPYQAELTVRRALALAGGLGFARTSGAEEASRLRREKSETSLALARARARLDRLTAELDGAETFDPAPLTGPVGPEGAEILALEARRFESDRAEAAEEKAHLARAADLARSRIAVLSEERLLQQRLEERQAVEIARIRGIQERGLASQARVTEEQRVLDSVQERAAANETEMAAAQEGLEAATYAFDRFDDRRRAMLETEKQEALTAVETSATTLGGIDRRLAEIGLSDLGQVRIMIYPGDGSAPEGKNADFAALLAPGDTLEATLEFNDGATGGSAAVPDTPAAAPAKVPATNAATLDPSHKVKP